MEHQHPASGSDSHNVQPVSRSTRNEIEGEGTQKIEAGMPGDAALAPYALRLANDSYQWYRTAAVRSRKAYRGLETAILVASAAIPVAAAIKPHNAIVPAVLGSVIVVLSGVRAIFHWQDNYLRFSAAREAIESERRSYNTMAEPYDDPNTRDLNLAASVSRIEYDEMSNWTKIAAQRPGKVTEA